MLCAECDQPIHGSDYCLAHEKGCRNRAAGGIVVDCYCDLLVHADCCPECRREPMTTDYDDDIAEAEAYAEGGLALSRKTAGRLAAAVRALSDKDMAWAVRWQQQHDRARRAENRINQLEAAGRSAIVWWDADEQGGEAEMEHLRALLAVPVRPGGTDKPTSDVKITNLTADDITSANESIDVSNRIRPVKLPEGDDDGPRTDYFKLTHRRLRLFVPFRWRTGTNPDGQHILICDRGGTPDSPQPNDTWQITLEPPDFKYDDEALETLVAMVDLWPAALIVIARLLRGWHPIGTAWSKYDSRTGDGGIPDEPTSDLERRVLDLLAPENTT